MSENKPSNHYVDNKRLYRELLDYHHKKQHARENDEPMPQVPDYVAWSIIQIAEHMATRPNFRNYTYIDEMIGDAIEQGITKVDNFDPINYTNPFGFFSLIMWRRFTARIGTEHKENRVKKKMIENAGADMEAFVENSESLPGNNFRDLQEDALSYWND